MIYDVVDQPASLDQTIMSLLALLESLKSTPNQDHVSPVLKSYPNYDWAIQLKS